MNNNQTNSGKIEELIDKIFLLNHNIVEFMICEAKSEELSENYKRIENIIFTKLSICYKKLRECILKHLNYSKELLIEQLKNSYSEEIIEESIISEIENIKKELLTNMTERIQEPFKEMNLVQMIFLKDNSLSYKVKESIYQGTIEENIRITEFELLKKSITEQISIINFEEYLEKHNNFMSPLISPVLIDSYSNMTKSSIEEKKCRMLIKKYNDNKEQFENVPEVNDFIEYIQYLRVEERYKRLFEKYVGVLNPNTSYGEKFILSYKSGTLDKDIGFSNEEIYLRVKNSNEKYSKENNKKIRDLLDIAIEKNRLIKGEEISEEMLIEILKFIKDEQKEDDIRISFKEER